MSRPHSTQGKAAYHHGDLRRSLIDQGLLLTREQGIEGLSLRKLAERVGVSPTAIYHYFRDKQDLLLALGDVAIEQFTGELNAAIKDKPLDLQLDLFAAAYIRFARNNPELYELMLGRATWQSERQHDFQQRAKQSIRQIGEVMLTLQANGAIPAHINTLRMIQVCWATLHGLCRMHNDGLAFTAETIEDIGHYAVVLLRQALRAG